MRGLASSYKILSKSDLWSLLLLQNDIYREGLNLERVITIVTERTNEIVGADGAVIELIEKDELVYRAVAGVAGNTLGLRLKVSSSLSGIAIEQGEILVCDDSEIDPRVNLEACRKEGLRSMIVAPISP